METYVYDFAEAADLGSELLGGKGAGLAEMTAIGITVPAGFTVTTAACVEYMQNGRAFPPGSRRRSRPTSSASRKQPGRASETPTILSSFPSAPGRPSRCPG
jgi:pyruvate,orthophosphate dikinase